MADDELAGLIPFFMIGIICNLIAALLQYSFSANATLSDILGYRTMIGMFANVNHFSTLVFASIPIFVYSGVFLRRRIFSVVCLSLIFLILLAAGSRAGILIGMGALFVSIASLLWRGRMSSGITLALIIMLAIYGYGALSKLGEEGIGLDAIRGDIAHTTLEAVRDNYLFGVGFGTFDLSTQSMRKPKT
ncbi:hypothetical protein [Mesorhizobium sp. J428]|uniref:hypothetical protein n=1 Tax=Mesorhizobium sp. J428 TaxID=2898440 RepID=UPI002150F5E7|nr:hypothetical protein [Mesorhizobium sp. J428]MCR5858290.1 hypothetical protein [Mesorhizobium sp. J428]